MKVSKSSLGWIIVLALVLLMASMASASTIAIQPPVIAGGHDSTRHLTEPLLREALTNAGFQVVSGDADYTVSAQVRIAAPYTYHLLSGRRSNGRCWLTVSVVDRAGNAVFSNLASAAVSDKTAARTAAGFVSEFAGVGMLTGQLFRSYRYNTWALPRGRVMGGVLFVAPYFISGHRAPLEQLAVASAARDTCQKLMELTASLPVAQAPTATTVAQATTEPTEAMEASEPTETTESTAVAQAPAPTQ